MPEKPDPTIPLMAADMRRKGIVREGESLSPEAYLGFLGAGPRQFQLVRQYRLDDGRLVAIHRGPAIPGQWDLYYSADHPLAQVIEALIKRLETE